MEHYPDISYDFLHYTDSNGMVKDYIVAPDGSCSVECVVTINEITKKMWLAVTDYNNKAIKNPSCVDIANTKMRCLTKCIATGFGLGWYIYLGDALPKEDTPEFYTEQQTAKYDEYKNHKVFDVDFLSSSLTAFFLPLKQSCFISSANSVVSSSV